MKRLFSYSAILFVIAISLTNAVEAVTLPSAELANALTKAVIIDSQDRTFSADIDSSDVDGKTVILKSGDVEIEASSVVYIEFLEGEESQALTSINKNDFNDFTGLTTLYLNNCTELTAIDLSGNGSIQVLNVSNLSKVRTINASSMRKLRDVHIATLSVESSNPMSMMMGGETAPSSCTLTTGILSALTNFDLSGNPSLSSVNYLLLKEAGNMFGGGGDSTPSKYGAKAHAVLTSLKNGSQFLRSETSYAIEEEDTSGFGSFMGGGTDDTLGVYSEADVNLMPALTTLNLRNSGLGTSGTFDYVKEIDIDFLTSLNSANFSGMTRLSNVSLPRGTALRTLNLTGDSALESLELSYTKGFVFPIGFETLTGLLELRMYGREEVNAIDVTPFTKLAKLNLTGDRLTSLDISRNKELVTLYIGNNMVRELDLSEHTKIRSLDISNNSIVKIDLSRNINIRSHADPSENADIRLSSQTREMTTEMSKTFNFRELYPQLTPVERGNIVWESIEGNGIKPVSFDVAKGTATFSYYPALITYDYKSGINYENTSTPLCMNVRLIWNKTDSEIDELYEKESDDEIIAVPSSSSGGCNVGTGALSVITLAGSLLILKRKDI
ncbi:MAG: hypothetical protein IJQ75_04875 [Synergistaceae bacterium]|nr:hypothetical protein [Synergistaceae bacterium]